MKDELKQTLQDICDYLYESLDGEGYRRDFFNDPEITIVHQELLNDLDDQWWPENVVFKWKGKYYSVTNNKASYNGNIEWHTLKEVVPKEVTKTVYEVI